MFRSISILIGLVLTGGCGLIERAACGEPCESGIVAAAGDPSDFTLAGYEEDGASVSDAQPCEDEDDVFVTTIETTGDDAPVGTWISDRVAPELQARGLSVSRALGACVSFESEGALGLRLGTNDWADLDPIAQTVLDLAAEDDVAVSVVVAVEPEILACADVGCGS